MPNSFRRGLLLLLLLGILGPLLAWFLLRHDRSSKATRRIAADQVHRFPVKVRAGELLHVQVEQLGVDLRLALAVASSALTGDAGLGELQWIDSPNGVEGLENLWWIAETDGKVEVMVDAPPVTSAVAHGGRYRLGGLQPRSPGPGDAERAAGQRLLLQGDRLGRLGDSAAALDAYRRALRAFRRAPEQGQIALTLRRIGTLQLAYGEPQEALDTIREAEITYLELGDLRGRAAMAILGGNAHRRLGRYDGAVTAYRRARAAAVKAGDGGNQATAINNLAMIEERRGELERAAEQFQQARRLFRKHVPDFEVTALLNLAKVQMRLGQMTVARRGLEEARILSEDRHLDPWPVDIQVGWWHHLTGNSRRGIEPLRRAARQLGIDFESQPLEPAFSRDAAGALGRLGTVLAAAGEAELALQAFDSALAFFEVGSNIADAAHIRANLCRLLRKDQPVRADELCRAALDDLERLGEITAEASTLYELARLKRQQGRLLEALGYIRKARDRVESVRFRLSRRDLQGSFLGARQDFEDLHLQILMELHARDPGGSWAARALEESERVRGRILLEMLAEAEVNLRRNIPTDLRRRLAAVESALEEALRSQWEVAAEMAPFTRLHDELAVEEMTEANAAVDRLIGEYHRLEDEIRHQSPAYAELAHPRPLTLDEMRRLLDSETVFLSFWLGEGQSFAWVLSRDGLSSHRLADQREIESWARRWYRLIAADPKAAFRVRRRDRSADRLAELLLAPLAGKLRAKRLVIVADGALQLIPFAALPDPLASEPRALIESHEICRLPSFASILNLRRREPRRPPPQAGFLAVISDPIFVPGDERMPQSLSAQASALPRLPGTAAEARTILRTAGDRKTLHLEGSEALRQNVLEILENFEIVHFATHAILDSRSPLLSRIALSPTGSRKNPEPNDLLALDLYSLESSAQLVALSSCRTVQEVRGEGLVGLSRGFMYAGVPRLLVSLWQVDDDAATPVLMQRFYRNLQERQLPPPEALRRAQLSMLTEGFSPSNWAAFTLLGEWRPIPPSKH